VGGAIGNISIQISAEISRNMTADGN